MKTTSENLHEIIRDSSDTLDALILSFSGLICPFCGIADLFVRAPGTRHWSGQLTWWTLGCESRKCNSCWTLSEDTYERLMAKIQFAQKNPTNYSKGLVSTTSFEKRHENDTRKH